MTTSRLIEEAKKLGYEVIKPRENERYEIVSAESKEEAEKIAKHRSKYWHPVVQTGKDSE
ncbi:MAG: DUF1381 domain-containing protein [Staphylococcus equorum]